MTRGIHEHQTTTALACEEGDDTYNVKCSFEQPASESMQLQRVQYNLTLDNRSFSKSSRLSRGHIECLKSIGSVWAIMSCTGWIGIER